MVERKPSTVWARETTLWVPSDAAERRALRAVRFPLTAREPASSEGMARRDPEARRRIDFAASLLFWLM
jgi:hypothetical protein